LASVYVQGNASTVDPSAFGSDSKVTIYYLPGTTGWSSTFGGCPAVLWNPLIQTRGSGFGVRTNHFGFYINGTANIPIVVEACTNLASPVWTPVKTNILINGFYFFSEPLQTNCFGRYYRIRSR
jgi:hypothetical protein